MKFISAKTEKYLTRVMAEKIQSDNPPTIGSDNISADIWAIYNYMDSSKCNLINYADSSSKTDDFLIANYDANPEWRNLYDSLDYDPFSDKHLLRRKFPATKIRFGVNDRITTDSLTTKTFYKLYEGYINKISGKEILVTLNMTLETIEPPFTGYIVFDIFDNKHKSVYYSVNALHRIKKSWDGTPNNFNYSFKTKPAPDNCLKLRVYFWSKNKQPYLIRDGKLSAYYYK
ncbi:MAG: hypothetical protein K8S16_07720 [Bacteroidales bacterium]|nr:hypothetical protein [Bacteroidales bacterium]